MSAPIACREPWTLERSGWSYRWSIRWKKRGPLWQHAVTSRGHPKLRSRPASLTLGADPTLIDRETLCFVQIETVAGAEHADQICAVAGLAGVVIGPGDLALSLGLEPSKWEDEPAHRAMRRTILVACLRAGIVPGTFTPSPQSAVRAVREGSRLVALSTDLGLMLEAARTGAAAVRSVASPLAADIATSD